MIGSPVCQSATVFDVLSSGIDVSVYRFQDGKLKHKKELSVISKMMQISLLGQCSPRAPETLVSAKLLQPMMFCLFVSPVGVCQFQEAELKDQKRAAWIW